MEAAPIRARPRTTTDREEDRGSEEDRVSLAEESIRRKRVSELEHGEGVPAKWIQGAVGLKWNPLLLQGTPPIIPCLANEARRGAPPGSPLRCRRLSRSDEL